MLKTCLICTDFTDGLDRLTEFVTDLLQSNLGHIIFFHSVSLEQQGQIPREDAHEIKEAREKLASGVPSSLPEGVKVSLEVLSGNPVEGVKRILQKYQVDFIIVGTPIRGGWKETIFGSTSIGIAKLTDSPILIIRPQLISTYTKEELALRCQHLLRYLLIPYDDTENSRYCVKHIKDYIKGFPQTKIKKCMLISVVEESKRYSELTANKIDKAQAKLAEVKKELEEVALEVNTEVRHGDFVAETLKSALKFDISAIAVGNDQETNPLEWTVPSLASEILRRSWYPVLLLSPKR
jgi:nucleotide-binding universal stress UspA family protein